MHFANPAALWLLTLLIPLVLLYLLKQKRREHVVPSLFLWKEAIEDVRARTPFQKLRSSLLLLIQILILVLFTAVLAQPYSLQSPRNSSRWILVLDNSASMRATDVKPNRLAVARNQLLRELDRFAELDEVLAISFSADTAVLQGFSRNHAAARKQLEQVEATDLSNRWDNLRTLLEPLLKEKPQPQIFIASDFSNCPADFVSGIPFRAFSVGTNSENAAIVQAALEAVPGEKLAQNLFIKVANFSNNTRSIGIEILKGEQLTDAIETRIEPMKTVERELRLNIEKEELIKIQLQPSDPLLLDNDFLLQARPRENISVSTDLRNRYLLSALQALPAVDVAVSAKIRIASGNVSPETPGIYFQTGSEKGLTQIVQWNASHPAFRFVDPGLWRFSNYSVLIVPPKAEVLFETRDGPAGYALSDGKSRSIVLGFPLEQSNIMRFAGFPVFLQNSIDWIHEGLEPPLPTYTNLDRKQEGHFIEGNRSGFVNFADPTESNIMIQRISQSGSPTTRTTVLRKDFSNLLLILLTAIIILEWYAFHRRYEK